jgi:hypothetical protein
MVGFSPLVVSLFSTAGRRRPSHVDMLPGTFSPDPWKPLESGSTVFVGARC